MTEGINSNAAIDFNNEAANNYYKAMKHGIDKTSSTTKKDIVKSKAEDTNEVSNNNIPNDEIAIIRAAQIAKAREEIITKVLQFAKTPEDIPKLLLALKEDDMKGGKLDTNELYFAILNRQQKELKKEEERKQQDELRQKVNPAMDDEESLNTVDVGVNELAVIQINNNSVASKQNTNGNSNTADKLAIIQVNKNNSMYSIPSSPEEQYTQSIDGARTVRMLKNDLLEAVYSAKDDNNYKRILVILDSLDKVDMNSSILSETGVGKSVAKLKHHDNKHVATRAIILVNKWKEIVKYEKSLDRDKRPLPPSAISRAYSLPSSAKASSIITSNSSISDKGPLNPKLVARDTLVSTLDMIGDWIYIYFVYHSAGTIRRQVHQYNLLVFMVTFVSILGTLMSAAVIFASMQSIYPWMSLMNDRFRRLNGFVSGCTSSKLSMSLILWHHLPVFVLVSMLDLTYFGFTFCGLFTVITSMLALINAIRTEGHCSERYDCSEGYHQGTVKKTNKPIDDMCCEMATVACSDEGSDDDIQADYYAMV